MDAVSSAMSTFTAAISWAIPPLAPERSRQALSWHPCWPRCAVNSPASNLRVEVSNCTLLLKRLLDEDIEFIVADTQELPSDKALSIEPLRWEAAAFYVRAGHPLDGRRSVSLHEAWGY